MNISIAIDNPTCTKCGKCVNVCPAHIFGKDKTEKTIRAQYVETCIKCGHCVASCPTASVSHSAFPPGKIHAVDRKLLPTPEQVMLLCKLRRSNRAFASQPVSQEKLDMILEAAHRAPTASNLQQVRFTLVTNPAVLKQIGNLTIEIFSSLVKKIETPGLKSFVKMMLPEIYGFLPRFKKLKDEQLQGDDPILHHATALILIHTPEGSRFGCQDANLAYQNGSLMAESLGVAQFYTGFLCTAITQDKKRRFNNLLGINGTIQAGMALALPQFTFPNYIDRDEIKVSRI